MFKKYGRTKRIYSWVKGVAKQLHLDKASGVFTFAASLDPTAVYPEHPNQAPNIDALPFVETECARELGRLLDSAGLMFHPKYQAEMLHLKDSDRYGSIYTQFSREIAKWVNDPERTRLSNLFVPYDPNFMGDVLLRSNNAVSQRNLDINLWRYDDVQTKDNIDIALTEQSVRDAWVKADKSSINGEAANVLVAMTDAVLARDTTKPQLSDMPVTGQQFHISVGACFDVAAYYIGASGEVKGRQGIKVVNDGTVSMLEKTHGSHTFMLTKPAVFNGVTLPKGSLLSKESDGYGFLRLTPFTFDAVADQLALDPELAKVRQNEARNIQVLGGITMSHLVDAVNGKGFSSVR